MAKMDKIIELVEMDKVVEMVEVDARPLGLILLPHFRQARPRGLIPVTLGPVTVFDFQLPQPCSTILSVLTQDVQSKPSKSVT